ncbi:MULTISPECIES: GNAT family N-acetyltransferase [Kitasatospora]|uniref:Putative acetyltransferase n=1 Tax=Kitasatospora setae (strain ATCC 33774 / DSM 43861 / JCM 3304 / KCC A-0304 / NBRC 14216 / KM-6054) TaxID=452652 RepID=E4N6E2_KITSK|nr:MULTISPECIES: GNAT family N-acetyltransferase [Kitasatospora]BAJ26773.1 putative acetyltransferase [Kitasatospora setae KM-6054]
MNLTTDEVAAAGAAWVWRPDDAEVFADGTCTVLRLPDRYAFDLSVVSFTPTGPLGAAVDAVLALARTLGPPVLDWQVLIGDPPGLGAELAARGGRVKLGLEILAADLSAGAPPTVASGAASGAATELRWVRDPATARDAAAIEVIGFGGELPPAAWYEDAAARGGASVPAGRGGTLVAYADGTPVGAASLELVDGVARLTGGVVVPSWRGRGVYRELLGARLAYGVANGARLALVKANPDTSGPILRRNGFTGFGQEPVYVVRLG